MTPTPQDYALAKQISDYLILGMHHATKDGQEAIAQIVATHTFNERYEAGLQVFNETDCGKLRAERDNALCALDYHPDSYNVNLADEISRLRDENRNWFHEATRRMNEAQTLDELNLELARLAAEEREKNAIIP